MALMNQRFLWGVLWFLFPGVVLAQALPAGSGEGTGKTAIEASANSASGLGIIVGSEEVILPRDRKPYSWPDGIMGVLKSGARYTFIAAGSGYPIRTIGTLEDPQAEGVVDLKIDQLQEAYSYAAGGPIYKDSHTGILLMIYHAERWIFPMNWLPFYGELGMARSSDGGETWIDLGPIITPHAPLESDYFQRRQETFDVGGGGYLIIGDYFYVYFSDLIKSGEEYSVANLAVARAHVSEVVQAAREGRNSVRWTKYYNGSWTEPGIGGRSTPLAPDNQEVLWGDVSYNAHLGKYISLSAGAPWPATDLYWAESDDGLHWTNYCRMVVDSAHKYYVTMVGVGENPRETGESFYLYYIRSRLYAQWGNRNEDAVLVRRLLTLTKGAGVCR